MEVVVRSPQVGDVRYWLSTLLGQYPLPRAGGKQDGEAPAVLLRSSSGEEYVFQRTGTTRQARRVATRLERDIAAYGPEKVATHYGIPARFAQ
jgi:hypothetical protein